MKFFIILTVVVFVAVGIQAITEEEKKKVEEVCTKEIGVKPELAEKLKTGDFSDKSEKNQCFSKCLFQKVGFMDASGHFQEKVVIEKLSEGEDKATVEKLVNACKNEKGANDCETAHKIHECYIKKKLHSA